MGVMKSMVQGESGAGDKCDSRMLLRDFGVRLLGDNSVVWGISNHNLETVSP